MGLFSGLRGRRQAGRGGADPPASRTYDPRAFRAEYKAIAESTLFDLSFYSLHNPDFLNAGMDPVEHYLKIGAMRGASPHACFDHAYYVSQHLAGAADGPNPLAHYLTYGRQRQHNPHPLFNCDYYLSQGPQLRSSQTCLLEHFLAEGAGQNLKPNPYFEPAYYLEQYADVRESRINPLVHFIIVGASQGRNPGPRFDTVYYTRENPDVAASGLNPLSHFILNGEAGRRRASPDFSPSFDARALFLLKQIRAEAEFAVMFLSDDCALAGCAETLAIAPSLDNRVARYCLGLDRGASFRIRLWAACAPEDICLTFNRQTQEAELLAVLEMLRLDELSVIYRMGSPFALRWLVDSLRLPYVLKADLGDGGHSGLPASEGEPLESQWRPDYDWLVSGADRLLA